MPETILITIGNHHLGFTLPTPRAPVYIPRNHTFQLKENVTNQLQSPNEYGKLPYETNWVLIKKLMEDPHPFVSLETNHNFILGQNRLLFAPRNGAFGWTDWEACERESALRNPFNQPLPIVNESNTRNANSWNAGGAWAAFPASSSAPSASASARVFTSAVSSSSRPFATSFASSGARADTSFDATSRTTASSTFASSSFARASPLSPPSMSADDDDESDESDENVKNEDEKHPRRVFTVDDDDDRDHH